MVVRRAIRWRRQHACSVGRLISWRCARGALCAPSPAACSSRPRQLTLDLSMAHW